MPKPPDSILVADIGSVKTKIGLIDLVGNEFRFVGAGTSLTTIEPPYSDALVGVRRAIAQLEAHTRRRFLADDGQLISPEHSGGEGVDAFVAVTSAPPPLRVAIVGLSREVSVASAARAVNSTYAAIETTLALDEIGGRWMQTFPQNADGNAADKKSTTTFQDPAVIAAETLARANPDMIVLVGGIDGGATTALYEIANLVAAIVASRDDGTTRLPVIFAGNREARPEIAARLGSVATLRMIDNVHPALDREDLASLQRELEMVYAERKIARLPGWAGMATWSKVSMLPTAKSFEYVIRFLSRRYGLSVLGADIGGASTTVVTARNGAFSRVVRADLGLGYNVENVVARAGAERLKSWLPFEISPDEALTHWLNQSFHPATIPATREDAMLTQAAAREAIALAAREGRMDTRAVDLVVLTGGVFSQNSKLESLALLALDSLQPQGVFTLAVDPFGLASSFGAMAAVNASAAANVIEQDGFVTLGTVIAPISDNRDGQVDLRIKMKSKSSAMEVEVEHGSLELIPLATGEKASVEITPSPGVDIGRGRRGIFRADIEGGALGIIIDARGRPISLPPNAEKRRAKIQQWLWDVGGG